MVNVGPMSS